MKKIILLYFIFFSCIAYCQSENQQNTKHEEGVFYFKGEEIRVSNTGGVAEDLPKIENKNTKLIGKEKIKNPSKNEKSFEERFQELYDSAQGGEKIESIPLSSIPKRNENFNKNSNYKLKVEELLVIIIAIIMLILTINQVKINKKDDKVNLSENIKDKTKKTEVEDKININNDILSELDKLQKLKDKGTIDENEFIVLKKKILNS